MRARYYQTDYPEPSGMPAPEVRATHPTEASLRFLLANVYICSGNRKRVTRELRAILETWSDHAPARQLLQDLPNIFGDS